MFVFACDCVHEYVICVTLCKIHVYTNITHITALGGAHSGSPQFYTHVKSHTHTFELHCPITVEYCNCHHVCHLSVLFLPLIL